MATWKYTIMYEQHLKTRHNKQMLNVNNENRSSCYSCIIVFKRSYLILFFISFFVRTYITAYFIIFFNSAIFQQFRHIFQTTCKYLVEAHVCRTVQNLTKSEIIIKNNILLNDPNWFLWVSLVNYLIIYFKITALTNS